MSASVRTPDRDEHGLPLCDESCPHHDGKRCREIGFRPDRFCEPQLRDDYAARPKKAEAERDAALASEARAKGEAERMGALLQDARLLLEDAAPDEELGGMARRDWQSRHADWLMRCLPAAPAPKECPINRCGYTAMHGCACEGACLECHAAPAPKEEKSRG